MTTPITVRIAHTSDWHLGRVLRQVKRLDDQLERVEEILQICDQRQVDLLLVAGDFLDETRDQRMTTVLRELGTLLRPRLERGMQMVVIAGNHDQEWVFPHLQTAHDLFFGEAHSGLQFIWKPQLRVIETPRGGRVRLLCLPYPYPARYDLEAITSTGAADTHRQLAQAVGERIARFTREIQSDAERMPTIVLAHFLVAGQKAHDHELTEDNDIPIARIELPNFAYTALGHVHLPTELGSPACRYSGSMERMDFGEIDQDRQIVLAEFDEAGLVGDPEPVPLHPTEFVDLEWRDGDDLAARVKDVDPRAICRLRIHAPVGSNVQPVQAQARELIARLCWPPEVIWEGTGEDEGGAASTLAMDRADWRGTVRDYVGEMVREDDPQRTALLAAVEELITAAAEGAA